MGRIYGASKSSGGRIYGGSTSSSPSTATDYEEVLKLAGTQGYEAPKPKVSMLTRLGNVLSSFEPGGEFTTLARTGDLGKAGKQYGSEVLRGLGSGIGALDEYTRPNELAENREGFTDLLKELDVPEGEINVGGVRLGSARGAAGLAGDIFLDPSNLFLAGLFKGAGKGVGKVSGKAAQILSKSEKGQDVLSGLSKASEGVKEAFVPAYKASKIAPDAVEATKVLKRTQRLGDEDMAKATKALLDKYGLETFQKVPQEIEAWGQATQKGLPAPELSSAAQDTMKLIKDVTGSEVESGLRKADIEAYFPRIVKKSTTKGPAMAQGGISTKIGQGGYDPTKGRKFSTLDEAKEAGIEYIEPEVALTQRLMYSQRAQKAKGALNQMTTGAIKDVDGNPILKKITKEEGLLPDHVAVLVDKNGIKVGEKAIAFYPEVSAAGKKVVAVTSRKATYQMHKDVADYMVNVQKVFGNDEATKGALGVYDYVQNLWKASVTAPFPSFHARNVLSNIFNNFVGGVKNPLRYGQAAKIQKGVGQLPPDLQKVFPDVKTFEEARDLLQSVGVRGAGQFSAEVTDDMARLMGRAPAGNVLSKGMRGGKAVGTFLEDNARIAHYLDKIGKGMSPDEAVKSVNKFLFDYSDLSKFEAEIMKRIFPFYTWSRKNIPLQVEQIFKQPSKYKGVMDAVRAFGKEDLTEDEKKYMPEYLREKFGLQIGRTKDGDPQILAGLDLPLEDITKIGSPLKSAVDLMAPGIKAPIEIGTGYSMFHKKPIKDTKAYNSTTDAIDDIPILNKIPGLLPGLKKFMGAKKREDYEGDSYYQVDPKKMYLLKLLAGRFISQGEALTDDKLTLGSKALKLLLGGKIYSPDTEYEKEKQVMDALKEMGIAKTFSRDYVPSQVKEELGLPTRKKKKQ